MQLSRSHTVTKPMKFDTRKRRKRAYRPKSAKAANSKVLKNALGRRRRNCPEYVVATPESVFALRQFLGMTQESFAAQLGVTKLTVSYWETRHRAPSRELSDKLHELAAMNGVSLEKLSDKAYYQAKTRVRVFMGPSQTSGVPGANPIPKMETLQA